MGITKAKKTGFILILCAMLFISMVLLVFVVEQKELNKEFDTLVSDNLTSFTSIQCNEIKDLIRDIQNSLTAISRMASSPLCTANDEEMELFLKELGNENEIYQVDYLPMAQLKEGASLRKDHAGDIYVYEKMVKGEPVISDIEYSNRLGGYFFAIVHPVIKNGETIGVLRVRVNADLFNRAFEKNPMYSNVYNCIIDRDGNILYVNVQGQQSTGNLYSSLKGAYSSDRIAERLKGLVDQRQEDTFQMPLKKKKYFISAGNLCYNDWYIVNFLHSSDVTFGSDIIFRRMILSSTFLILLTAVACGMMAYAFIKQKRKLDFEMRRYYMLSQFSDTILFEYRYSTDSIEFTPNARKRLSLEELVIKGISSQDREYTLLHFDDRKILVDIIQRFSQKTGDEQQLYHKLRLKNLSGEYYWYGCQIRYIYEKEIPVMIIGKLVDITDQRSREKELLNQAQRDTLTNTYNKSGEELIEEQLRKKNKGLLFMIDLDDFKRINDTYGHVAGDKLLANIGVMLNRIFRMGDIVVRVGGDEFAVFIPGTSSRQLAEQRAINIKEQLCSLRLEDYPDIHVSVSIGIAIAPLNGGSFTELYTAADKAMYQIKCKNKDGYCFYDL